MTKLVGQQLEMQVLKSLDLENESPEIQQIFSPLKVYIENGVTQLKTSSNTAVEGLPTCSNENLIKVLHSLSTLGKKAEEDLQSIERYRQDVVRLESTEDRQENSFEEHKELGISGATLEKPQDSPRFVPDDLFGYRKEPLPEDNSLQNVYSLLKKCRNLLQNVNGQAQSRDNLMKLLKLEDELMVNLRKYKALQSVCLSLPIENEEQLNRDLHALFANTFKHISSSDSQLSAYMKGAWVWEVSPEPSVLPSTKIDGLKLRLYGVESVDLQESKAFLEQDRDGDEALGKKVLLEKSPDSNHDGGLVLFINNLCLKDFQTARKRGVDFKLCRMATSIVAEISSFRVNIKCISLPFIIRTGSTQLWPYISNIVWFIWAQRDVCESDCKCPKELPLSSVLALIQARIVGAGLRLSNRALQRKMASGEKGLEVALPHKLTDGERMGWEEIIKQKCGIESNREPVVLKQNFIKQSNDCCLWAQVCGAVYTGLRLKKYDLDRFFHIGISHEMCESLSCVEQGEFLLRSSHNRRKQASGREPLAGVVIEMYLKEKVHPRVYLVEHFEKWTLKEIISHIKFEGEKHGSNIVRRILPSREDIQSLHEEPRQVFDENQYKRQHTGSAVPDQKELPPVIVISNQFQNLSLNPGTPRNFAGQSPLWPSPDDGKHKETIPPIMEDAEMHEEGARLPVTEMGIDSGEEKLLGAEGFVECQTDAASSSTTALDEDIENMELLPQETLDFLYSSTSHEMEIQSTLLQSMSSEHNQEDQLT